MENTKYYSYFVFDNNILRSPTDMKFDEPEFVSNAKVHS